VGGTGSSLRFLLLFLVVCTLGATTGYFVAAQFNVPRGQTPGQNPIYTTTPSAAELKLTADYGTKIAATVQVVMGGLLFEDPLVQSASEETNSIDTIKNTEKGLMITVNQLGHSIFTIADSSDLPTDMDVSVTAQGLLPNQCKRWSYSLNIRQQIRGNETGDYYVLYVQSDHTWGFSYYDPSSGERELIVNQTTDPSFVFEQPNVLRAVAVGSHFDLYIN
jgi:hypothetical protein